MVLDYLKKSFFIQHWEFIVLFITIVYFVSKFRKNNNNQKKQQQKKVKSDDEVIASDYQNDDEEMSDENDELTPSLEDGEHIPYKGVKIKLNGGADEFLEMVSDRRSIRMFSNKEVDIEVVKKCIKAAGTSPSGAHTEPWTYCLIKESVYDKSK